MFPGEVREANPHIPWRLIIATRNRLIHGYLGIDNDTPVEHHPRRCSALAGTCLALGKGEWLTRTYHHLPNCKTGDQAHRVAWPRR